MVKYSQSYFVFQDILSGPNNHKIGLFMFSDNLLTINQLYNL